MSSFKLDQRLEADCHRIAETNNSLVLLLDNALYHWLVLVPKTELRELFELEDGFRQQVLDEVMQLSKFIKQSLGADKLNIGAIGNIVSQLHIHVIGRNHNDASWPGVVWGAKPHQAYTAEQVSDLKQLFENHSGLTFN